MADRVLVVGEAPSRRYGGRPLWGDSGRRFAALAGVAYGDLHRVAEVVNLLDAWPGAAPHGDQLPPRQAREAARALAPALAGRRVILLGGRVARAFGVNDGMLSRWRWIARLDARVAVVPHPSGVCRSYNDAATREAAARFLRRALGGVTDPAPAPLPLQGRTA